MTLQMRDPTTMESTYPFPRYYGTPEWLKFWHPLRWLLEQHHCDIRVEEYVEDGTLVVRAEIPDIDPDVDVALMLADGCMRTPPDRLLVEDDDDGPPRTIPSRRAELRACRPTCGRARSRRRRAVRPCR